LLFLDYVNIEKDSLLEIVLKGHIFIESLLNSILREYFPSPKFFDEARLGFYQKLKLVRAKHWREQNNDIWVLVEKINKLRNDMAHGLDQEKIKKSLNKVLEYQLQIEKQPEQIEMIKRHTPVYQLCLAFGLIEGFLKAYLKDSTLISEITLEMLKRYDHVSRS